MASLLVLGDSIGYNKIWGVSSRNEHQRANVKEKWLFGADEETDYGHCQCESHAWDWSYATSLRIRKLKFILEELRHVRVENLKRTNGKSLNHHVNQKCTGQSPNLLQETLFISLLRLICRMNRVPLQKWNKKNRSQHLDYARNPNNPIVCQKPIFVVYRCCR